MRSCCHQTNPNIFETKGLAPKSISWNRILPLASSKSDVVGLDGSLVHASMVSVCPSFETFECSSVLGNYH